MLSIPKSASRSASRSTTSGGYPVCSTTKLTRKASRSTLVPIIGSAARFVALTVGMAPADGAVDDEASEEGEAVAAGTLESAAGPGGGSAIGATFGVAGEVIEPATA